MSSNLYTSSIIKDIFNITKNNKVDKGDKN